MPSTPRKKSSASLRESRKKDRKIDGSFVAKTAFWRRDRPIESVQELLENTEMREKFLTMTNESQQTALLMALEDELLDCAELLFDQPEVDLSHKDKGNDNAISYTLHFKYFDLAKKILPRFSKEDVNVKTVTHGSSCLHIAVENCAPDEVLQGLLQQGADPTAKDKDGRTPLMEACSQAEEGDAIRMVKMLLPVSSDVIKDQDKEGTALHWAITAGCLEVVSMVLDACPELLHIKNVQDRSPLFWAVQQGWVNVVQELIRRGADKDEKLEDGSTLLHIALEYGSDDVFKFLVSELELDPNAERVVGGMWYTVFGQSLVTAGKDFSIAEFLLQPPKGKAADLNHRCPDGSTAYHMCARNKVTKARKWFLERGYDETIKDSTGYDGIADMDTGKKKSHSKKSPSVQPKSPPSPKPSSQPAVVEQVEPPKTKQRSRKRAAPAPAEEAPPSRSRTRSGQDKAIAERTRTRSAAALAGSPKKSPSERKKRQSERLVKTQVEEELSPSLEGHTVTRSGRESRHKRVWDDNAPITAPVSAKKTRPAEAQRAAPAPHTANQGGDSNGIVYIDAEMIAERIRSILEDAGTRMMHEVVEPLFAACEKLQDKVNSTTGVSI